MLDFSKTKDNCTGCSACLASCPVKCIHMKVDEEGFEYPVSDDSCIDCGLCERICPISQNKEKTPFVGQRAYAAITKDENIWRRSASGGAFSEICYAWGNESTYVFGAAWDGLRLHHIGVKGVNSIAPLCKSKYVASLPENIFSEIKKLLYGGSKVIFCGTPCQVAGLKNFLRKDFDHLLTVDLICHGVGSPKTFRESMRAIENQFGIEILGYEFRAKRKFHETDYLCKVTGRYRDIYLIGDQYMQLFLSQLNLRPCCGKHCKFRNISRQGDLTIADLKGLSKVLPSKKGSKRNYSTIVVNSKKGTEIISALKKNMEIHEVEINNILKFNPLFGGQTWFNENRDDFFRDFAENPSMALNKWTKPAEIFKPKFAISIKNILPQRISKVIYKILGK